MDEYDEKGNGEPLWDTFETEFEWIIKYPKRYSSEELEWFDEHGCPVDFDRVREELKGG